ncbi:MAG: DNA gyrase/topoisomerase IV subunit A [Nocardioidaceae bacterium]
MARRTPSPPEDDFEEHIVDIDVRDEMRASYLEYAYSVIYSRALPDARDGLKPVQRRILYTMHDMGVRPDRGHVKSARVVGEVMGRLHPHGDSAIYDALVRMVQPWAMRLPLIDGHGNFGSPDDPPAAMRYSECRMASAAMPMTLGIDEETVEFKANYDSREFEPIVLPAAFPNLLVNGASGIAVGMATNLAPHNLVEVVQALRYLIMQPNASLDDLMRFIPGPDLPTGGKIVGLDGVREAYESGRGSFRMRSSARIENVTTRRKGIVITELPYNVGPERVIERIKMLVQTRKLQGIADVKDLTDRSKGLQLVIEIKNGFHPEAILEQLYRQTPMEDSFGINAVALVDGQPRTMGLKQMLEVYLDHRYDVVRRRSAFRRAKAADRRHLVDGLLIAILDIDEVIELIRSSDNADEARRRLMTVFDLTEIQANYILDMPLRRLTKFSKLELEKEKGELAQTIEELTATLDDESLLKKLVGDELNDVAKQHGTPRRTVLLESAGTTITASVPLEVTDDPCWVLWSSADLFARTTTDEPLGIAGARGKHDAVRAVAKTTVRGTIGVVTSHGRLIKLDVLDLPALPLTANAPHLQGGAPASEFLALQPDERIVTLTSLSAAPSDSVGLALGTKRGVVKRVLPDLLTKDSWDVIRLDDGDEVVGGVELGSPDDELVFITTDAQLLHFPASAVRPQGRSGAGISGVRLTPGAELTFFGAVDQARDNVVVTVAGSSDALPGTDAGSVKVTSFTEYPAKGRGTGGVRCHRFLRGESAIIVAFAGASPVKAAAASGAPIELPAELVRRDGSGAPAVQPIAAIGGRPRG